MTRVSIMQGRLLSPFEGRFQAFPAIGWEQEFQKAKQLGIYSIEWIFEKPHEHDNPLSTEKGIVNLKKTIQETEVQVKSICADYYMTSLLIKDGARVQENWDHLSWLLHQAKELSMTYIILPFVDSSSLKTTDDQKALAEALKNFLKKEETSGIEIHLEADLSPTQFLTLFELVNHPLLKMNYDTGNSASLGYDVDVELQLLGMYLGSVHIKDRKKNGGTVALDTGDTDFTKCFQWFKRLQFDKWFVLQCARGEEGQETETIKMQRQFVLKEMQN